MPTTFPIYLESGQKRAFAGAIDWPGWCRSGRDEASALQALAAYGRRYAGVLQTTDLGFSPPADAAALVVVERLPGNATTDFGAPDAVLAGDALPMATAELERLQLVLVASWQALNTALQTAAGKELRKGPRGGGRDLDAIARHVLDANANYLARLAWKQPPAMAANLGEEMARAQEATALALEAAGRGLTPTRGPRGGVIWAARTFARRAAWHLLDHAWEIEDRSA